jgi:hypothetical protein
VAKGVEGVAKGAAEDAAAASAWIPAPEGPPRIAHSPVPMDQGAGEGYSYRRVLCASVHGHKRPHRRGLRASGRGRAKGRRLELRPMIEADAPSTEEVVSVSCARPTGGSHGRTTRGPAQRFSGAKRRPGPRRTPAFSGRLCGYRSIARLVRPWRRYPPACPYAPGSPRRRPWHPPREP